MSGGAANRGDLNLDRSSGDFHYAEDYTYNAGVGLNATWCATSRKSRARSRGFSNFA